MTRMRTRSQVPLTERNEDVIAKQEVQRKKALVDTAPFIKYPGKIVYSTDFTSIAENCAKLLDKANKTEDLFILGFDIEWPFSFQTGSGKASVVQISPNLDICYVLQVSSSNKLPKALTELLCHDKVRLTGICVKNDVRKLHRDFPGFDVDKAVDNCIDLGVMANTVAGFTQRWSLEKLVLHFFEMRISKDKAVRMSKWHVAPLSESQQVYAALDAYASLKLYHHIKQEQDNQVDDEDQENQEMDVN